MEDRILILAPRGRDAQIASELIQQSGFPCTTCVDLDNMVVELDAGASAALITEEALAKGDRTGISDWLKSQPAWSVESWCMNPRNESRLRDWGRLRRRLQ